MYEYEFVTLDPKAPANVGDWQQEYRRVIEKHSLEGWRLSQIFAPTVGGELASGPLFCDLIFERETRRD